MSRPIYKIEPEGWPCSYADCPPGHFMYDGDLCFKSEYYCDDDYGIGYCSSGEVFWGGTSSKLKRHKLIVQSIIVISTEEGE